MANLTVPGNSILTMPLPDTKAAPERFRGKSSKIKAFLMHYELLLEQNNVLGDRDKCELITRYCSTTVTNFIQALPSFTRKNWSELRRNLLTYYDADFDNKRYRVKDLEKLERSCRSRYISDLRQWREYGRTFITMAGWLLKKEKISEDEYALAYWAGIHKKLRRKLENWLIASNPQRDLTNPFTYDEVNTAAEKVLMRDRFDANISEFESETSDEDRGKRSDSDDEDTSDSELEDIKRWKKKARRKTKRTKKRSSTSEEDSESEDEIRPARPVRHHKRKPTTTDEQEIEGMIKQLNSMKIEDPGYAALVFRALKRDPDILKVVRPPMVVARPTIPNSPLEPRNGPRFAEAPPHMSNLGFSPNNRNFEDRRRNGGGMSGVGGGKCFGCGMNGHRIGDCEEINDFVRKGEMKRDEAGRMVQADGQPIRRLFDEPIADAYRRAKRAQGSPNDGRLSSNLVQISLTDNEEMEKTYHGDLADSEGSEYDSDDEESFREDYDNLVSAAVAQDWGTGRRMEVYPALRTDRKMTQKRREMMESVTMPPPERRGRLERKDPRGGRVAKEREQRRPEEGNDRAVNNEPVRVSARAPAPVPKPSPQPVRKTPEVTRIREGPAPVVVDVRRPAFDGSKDDEIMEDVRPTRLPDVGLAPKKPDPRGTREVPINGQNAAQNGDRKSAGIRKSEVSNVVQPMEVLNQVLNTRIDLAIGQVLGISKEVSGLLSEKIKPKTMPKPILPPQPMIANITPISNPMARSVWTKNRGLLIQLQMQCNGRDVTAIIDTGSQLNIVNKKICDSRICMPVDSYESINIATANGSQSSLEGLIKDVPLNCGEVYTEANLYVGTKVPFELLLGRPWQRSNLVSIDERRNGTYLIFKDHKSNEPRYSILVAHDPLPIEPRCEIPTWNLREPVHAYHVSVEEGGVPKFAESSAIVPRFEQGTFQKQQLTIENKNEPLVLNSDYTYETSILDTKRGQLNLQNRPLQNRRVQELKGINTTLAKLKILSLLQAQLLESMSSGPTPSSQNPPLIPPLHSRPQIRTDSEVITTALADLPYLERTRNLHPLLLSTADGLLLGQSIDQVGQHSSDYLFLRGGLLDLSSKPLKSVHASYFVRAFTDLAGGPEPTWLSTYIKEAASEDPVSDEDIYWDQVMLTNAPANPQTASLSGSGREKHPPPMPTILEEPTPAPGSPEANYISTHTPNSLTNNSSPSSSTDNPLYSTPLPVPSNAKSTSGFSFGIAKHPFSTPVPSTLRIYSSPPHSPPGLITPSEDGYTSDSSKDADGDTDMDVEEASSVDTEEWETLKREIAEEQDRMMEDEQDDLLRSAKEKHSEERLRRNKENRGRNERTQEQVYAALKDAYLKQTNREPTESQMTDMQEMYIRVLQERTPQFKPLNTNIGGSLSPALAISALPNVPSNTPQPSTPVPPAMALPTSTTPELSYPSPFPSPTAPDRIVLHLDAPAILRAGRHPISDTATQVGDLRSPIQLLPPSVFFAQQVSPNTSTDSLAAQDGSEGTSQQTPTQHRQDTPFPISRPSTTTTHSSDNPLEAPASTDDNDPITYYQSTASDEEKLHNALSSHDRKRRRDTETSKSSETSLSVPPRDEVPTRPASPVELTERQKLSRRLQETRRVSREDLLANLRHEIAQVTLERDSFPTDSEHHRHYSSRLTETYERIKLLEQEAVAASDARLRKPWDIVARNDKPLISRSTPAGDDRTPPVVYNQPSDKIPRCPNYPELSEDPRKLPIAERPYYAAGANNWTRDSAQVRDVIFIDARSLTIVENARHVPQRQLKRFTELEGALSPFIFPGHTLSINRWPLDVPRTSARTIGQRLTEMEVGRRAAEALYQEIYRTLSEREVAECIRPHVTLYKRISPESLQLYTVKVDRIYFWARLHPVWNPYFKPAEAAFLRGAQYFFQTRGQREQAEEIETALRTPHYDDWEIRELVALGALEGEFRRDEALNYLRIADDDHWNFHASEMDISEDSEGKIVYDKLELPAVDYITIRPTENLADTESSDNPGDSSTCSHAR